MSKEKVQMAIMPVNDNFFTAAQKEIKASEGLAQKIQLISNVIKPHWTRK